VLLAESNRGVLADSAARCGRKQDRGSAQRAGDISRADQNQIEIAAERLELDAAGAEAQAHKARVALEVLLGEKEPRAKSSPPTRWIPWETFPPKRQRAAPVSPSRSGRRRRRAREAEADLRLQKAARIPDLTLLAQYEHEPPDQPNTAGFGVSFPLPLWNRNGGNIAAARAALEQTTARAEKIRAQAMADIAVARISYAEA